MWWDRSERADIYLSPTCLGLASERMPAALWVDTRDLDDGLERVAAVLSQEPWQSCRRVRVWLASTFARPLMLSAASGARNREEAKGLVTMLAPDATGFDEPVRVWANAWHANRGGLAVVMPESLWTALHRVVDQARSERVRLRRKGVARSLELVSVRPWWNHAIDAVMADSARDAVRIGWSVTDGGGVVHGIVDQGNLVDVGIDLLGEHDREGALLRRRLQVNWDAVAVSRHLVFARSGEGIPATLGVGRDMGNCP